MAAEPTEQVPAFKVFEIVEDTRGDDERRSWGLYANQWRAQRRRRELIKDRRIRSARILSRDVW